MKQLPPLSPQYNWVAMPSCRRLPVHWTRHADALALASVGSSMAARIAMIAMTTNSSRNVKARCFMVFQQRPASTAAAKHAGHRQSAPGAVDGGSGGKPSHQQPLILHSNVWPHSGQTLTRI